MSHLDPRPRQRDSLDEVNHLTKVSEAAHEALELGKAMTYNRVLFTFTASPAAPARLALSRPATENYPIVVGYLHAAWKPVTEAGDHYRSGRS